MKKYIKITSASRPLNIFIILYTYINFFNIYAKFISIQPHQHLLKNHFKLDFSNPGLQSRSQAI